MRLWFLLLFSLGILTWTDLAHAGYRVYQLKIEEYNASGKLDKIHLVLSTLDHLQYEHYNAGYGRMRVTLADTWFCPGDTSHFRGYCPPPKVRVRAPASYDPPKRVPLPYNRQPIIP
jgi:hypothetical protein